MRVLNASLTEPVEEAVLFPFDGDSLPFQRDLVLGLQSGRTNKAEMDYGNNIDLDERHPEGPVLTPGPPGSLDATEIVAPNVFRVDGEYRMWYTGADDRHRRRTGLYAVSADGFHWERPNLGLSEENGNTNNNRVRGPCGDLVLYDPEDPDPARRFKSIFDTGHAFRKSASFSEDGLHWRRGTDQDDLFGTGLQGGTIQRWGDGYYVTGQGGPSTMNRPIPHPVPKADKRIAVTFASYDFVHWTHAAAPSLRRDPIPPRPPENFEAHAGEQVHDGVAAWNRGNVLVGLYGQYHNPTNDRRDADLDFGFVVSHDALHYEEPVRDFKMVHSYEIRGLRVGNMEHFVSPRLVQRNAWANIGDRTVYWFSIWREEHSAWAEANPQFMTGVWVATWERDRFGWLSPCPRNYGSQAGVHDPHGISCPIELDREGCRLFVNADRLGEHSRLRVELLDLQFRPLPGYSGDACVLLDAPGLRQPVKWLEPDTLAKFDHPVRVCVRWEGVRREDPRLFAVYAANPA